ncbi:MAG TPA: RecX family transcriptional regulator [Ignavibacteriaceae bacterium]|nr:RecX family transcriptional regulator [Ignavibacteriaceae bacterium]
MVIEKIQKKDQDSVTVFISTGEKYTVNINTLITYSLQKGMEVTEELTENLKNEEERQKIIISALRYLAHRAHSSFEIQLKLERKKFKKHIIKEVILELTRKSYLNDAEFAQKYIHEMILKKKWGIKKMKNMLFQKGIRSEMVDIILAESELIQLKTENIRILCQKKYDSLKTTQNDLKVIKHKIFNYLISRGFDYIDIKETLDEIIPDQTLTFKE